MSEEPIDFGLLWKQTTLSISYASAGIVAAALLHGVPQLLAPAHIESQLTAARVEWMGVGLVLKAQLSQAAVGAMLRRLIETVDFKLRSASFAQRYRRFDTAKAADGVAAEIEGIAAPERRSSAA